MRFGVSVFFALCAFFNVGAKERIWKYTSDITNPENWLGGKVSKGCKGVHFAPVNTAPVSIHELRTGEVTLPSDGEVGIADGGFIEFEDNRKCIELKPIDYHEWYDPDSWLQTDDNVAIPDKQKVPCVHDDVIFPKMEYTRISDFAGALKVGSIRFDKDRVAYIQIENNMDSSRGHFINNVILSNINSCKDPYGCLCHEFSIPCPIKDNINDQQLECEDPVSPEDFCRDICGAYLTYKPEGPNLDNIREKLKEYSSDTHVSKVMDYLGNEVIQVVFSEKKYTGMSLLDADSFLQYLQSSQVGDVQMYKSGYSSLTFGTNPLSIVFGSLATVVIFFAVLIYLHNGTNPVTTFAYRFNRDRGSIFTPFFARFDNTDENLIIDGHSEAGSVLDIPKSFDNPMFGTPTPQTSATTEHENPLYEIAKDVNVEE